MRGRKMKKELAKILENLSKDKSGKPAFALTCDSLELNTEKGKFSLVLK